MLPTSGTPHGERSQISPSPRDPAARMRPDRESACSRCKRDLGKLLFLSPLMWQPSFPVPIRLSLARLTPAHREATYTYACAHSFRFRVVLSWNGVTNADPDRKSHRAAPRLVESAVNPTLVSHWGYLTEHVKHPRNHHTTRS